MRRLCAVLRRGILAAVTLAMTAGASAFGSSLTLSEVKARERSFAGSTRDCRGSPSSTSGRAWSGFDVDFCRAVTAAIFGDPNKVRLVPLSADARFQALADGKIDVLSRNSTWTMGRETEFGLAFVGVTYYDGQGFLVPRAMRVTSALELDGAKVCVQSGTTTIDNLADYFASNGMTLQEVVSSSTDNSIKKYDAGLCSVLTSDLSQLYALRLRLAKPRDHVILPDVISEEAPGAGRAPERPSVDRDRAMGPFRDDQCRGARRQFEDSWPGAEIAKARGDAPRRDVWEFRRRDRPFQRLGGQHRPVGRKLRRSVRPQSRRANAARHPARPEPIVERRRDPVRSSHSMMVFEWRSALPTPRFARFGGADLSGTALALGVRAVPSPPASLPSGEGERASVLSFVLEGNLELGAEGFDLSLFDHEVLLDDLGYAQVPQAHSRALDRGLGGLLQDSSLVPTSSITL